MAAIGRFCVVAYVADEQLVDGIIALVEDINND